MLHKVELMSTSRNMQPQLLTHYSLQCNSVARQVEIKCFPYYWDLTHSKKDFMCRLRKRRLNCASIVHLVLTSLSGITPSCRDVDNGLRSNLLYRTWAALGFEHNEIDSVANACFVQDSIL